MLNCALCFDFGVCRQPGVQLEDLPAYAFDGEGTFGRLFQTMLKQENKIALGLYRR